MNFQSISEKNACTASGFFGPCIARFSFFFCLSVCLVMKVICLVSHLFLFSCDCSPDMPSEVALSSDHYQSNI